MQKLNADQVASEVRWARALNQNQTMQSFEVASEVRWARALNQNQTMQSFDFKLNFKILAL